MNTLIKNINEVLTLEAARKKDGRNIQPEDSSIKKYVSLIHNDKKILWIGRLSEIPAEYSIDKEIDLEGHVMTPEIVDSHTHLVFGGDRSFEYTLRLNGADYQEIANAGGGILSSMEKTKAASESELFDKGVERVLRLKSYGVGTIEIKSGYGLTLESERKLTHVISRLKDHFKDSIQIKNTFMAAHAVPKSFDSSKRYLEEIVFPLFKEFAKEGVIDFVDVFHEEGYFSLEDCENLINLARELKIPFKMHADEFNDNGGAKFAATNGAISADHLLAASNDGINALAKSDTVATLLPGTAFFLGKPLPNARKMLDAGCKVALASDYNPGSCHCDNLLLIASIAAKNLGLNFTELWSSITLNAAAALMLENQGSIEVGMKPRFSIFECESLDQITYSWGRNFSK